jgi:uroporphyrinogen-III decarboxylase
VTLAAGAVSLDAAILFDILTVPDAMGLGLHLRKEKVRAALRGGMKPRSTAWTAPDLTRLNYVSMR